MKKKPVRLDIYRTAIPMRSFEHAAASREVAEAVVVRLEFDDGAAGWGETLPRQYVTGETIESVIDDISETLWPACAGRAVEDILPLPERRADGRCICAAGCAIDLAIWSRRFQVPFSAAGFSSRVSGVLGSADPARTARRLRAMRWFGLRDFKLKLGLGQETDAANLQVVHRKIGKAVARGKCTLRVDVNGAWDAAGTPARVAELKAHGVCVVEQPVYCSGEELLALARQCDLPLMADESLVTERDAEVLSAEPAKVWWNVRLSKNGGLTRAMSLARLAERRGVTLTLGCMVGESSLLSAAQRRLLQLIRPPRFVEGNYGRFLLAGDLTSRSLRFGYGGRLRPLRGGGLGVEVDPARIERYGRLVATLRD